MARDNYDFDDFCLYELFSRKTHRRVLFVLADAERPLMKSEIKERGDFSKSSKAVNGLYEMGLIEKAGSREPHGKPIDTWQISDVELERGIKKIIDSYDGSTQKGFRAIT